MAVTKLPSRVPRVSPVAYRRLTLVTLVALVLIIAIGTSVRLTGSGMGCPTWPSCEQDSLTPRSASDMAGVIEFGNRLAGVTLGMLSLATVAGAHLRAPRRRNLFRWALAVAALVVVNGLMGAQVVWAHLSPVMVVSHFLLAITALSAGVILHQRASEAAGDSPPSGLLATELEPPRRRPTCTPAFRRAANALLLVAGVTVVMGTVVTGSGPHAGDEDAERFSFAVGEVARIHGISAVVFLVMTLVVLWMAQRGDASERLEDPLRLLVLLIMLQGIVGYTQYFMGVPEGLVLAHVIGSALVWIGVLRVRLALSEPITAAAAPARSASVSDPSDRPAADTGGGPVPAGAGESTSAHTFGPGRR